MNWKDQLPTLLLPDLQRFVATERACVRLIIETTSPAERSSSAFGQIRYWPKSLDWPTDEHQRPLFGFLQLNLAELPALPGFPTAGIVQFFISDDAFWGANPILSTEQRNFRVVYHPNIQLSEQELLTDFSFLPSFIDLPIKEVCCYAISGQLSSMPMPPGDARFETVLGDIFTNLGDQQWECLKQYRKAIGTVGHRLGGYASFAQDDPRSSQPLPELLLQLDTDPQIGLMWGDYGVAHWFYNIEKSPIERSINTMSDHRFSSVSYSWESA